MHLTTHNLIAPLLALLPLALAQDGTLAYGEAFPGAIDSAGRCTGNSLGSSRILVADTISSTGDDLRGLGSCQKLDGADACFYLAGESNTGSCYLYTYDSEDCNGESLDLSVWRGPKTGNWLESAAFASTVRVATSGVKSWFIECPPYDLDWNDGAS